MARHLSFHCGSEGSAQPPCLCPSNPSTMDGIFPLVFSPITRFLLLANPAYVRPWFQLQKSVASSRKSWLRGSRFSQRAACPLSETTPGLWTRLATVLPHTARCEPEELVYTIHWPTPNTSKNSLFICLINQSWLQNNVCLFHLLQK